MRLDTNAKNVRARRMYKTLGYREIGIVDTTFNGIAGVELVLLETWRKQNKQDELSQALREFFIWERPMNFYQYISAR